MTAAENENISGAPVMRILHQCEHCSYVVTDAQFTAARFDYPCPRCGCSTLSEFLIFKESP